MACAESELARHPSYDVLVTGHSLGGALASYTAFDLATACPATLVTAITFGAPKPVNTKLRGAMGAIPNLRVYRVVN